MRIPWQLPLLLSLGAADGLALGTLVVRDAAATLTSGMAVGLGVLHVGFAIASSAAVVASVPKFGKRSVLPVAALGLVLGLFLPVLGAVGLGVALELGLNASRSGRGREWERLDPSELLDAPARLAAHRNVVAGDLIIALSDRTPQNAEHRFQVVLQTRHLAPRAAIGVLKVALKDPSDEVRLYAFSRIERFRASIEASIKSLHEARAQGTEDRTRIELRLAETNWELAYLGLTEGAVRTHALVTARTHAENATRLAPELAPARFMHGRILLALGEVVGASAAFTRAINLGYPRRRVLPYLAECAYRRKELDVLPEMMREVAATPQDHPYLSHVTDFWK